MGCKLASVKKHLTVNELFIRFKLLSKMVISRKQTKCTNDLSCYSSQQRDRRSWHSGAAALHRASGAAGGVPHAATAPQRDGASREHGSAGVPKPHQGPTEHPRGRLRSLRSQTWTYRRLHPQSGMAQRRATSRSKWVLKLNRNHVFCFSSSLCQ